MNKKPVSYFQTDKRWKNTDYSARGEKTTIGKSGCGPTCAAMCIETITGETFTPADACAWSLHHGFKAPNQGTYYSYFAPQMASFGIDCWMLNRSSVYGKPKAAVHEEAEQRLKDGYYLIACMGKGLWTSSGHYVLVWWADDKMYINDPASEKTERIRGDRDTFRQQVKYYWAVDAREHNKEEEEMRYDKISEMPLWAQRTAMKLCDKGYLTGGSGKKDDEGYPTGLNLSLDMLRILVINDRAGMYD